MKASKIHYLITHQQIMLVPYFKPFVKQYHEWMQDEDILLKTGSEPLSLDEEYDNQKSWLMDSTKYTFIIMRLKDQQKQLQVQQLSNEQCKNYFQQIINIKELGDECLIHAEMVGDVNLFFHSYLEPYEAEINIMIGEQKFRNQGISQTTLNLTMKFAFDKYNRTQFIAKIKTDNIASINLFKKLGFELHRHLEVFDEVHYIKKYSQSQNNQQINDLLVLSIDL